MNEMFSNDVGEELLHRIEMLNDELHRIKLFIEDSINGYDTEGLLNADIYQETSEFRDTASSYLNTIMYHLLKLTYSTTNRNHNGWRKTITRSLDNLQRKCLKSSSIGKDTRKFLQGKLDSIYTDAVEEYHKDARCYEDLQYNQDLIPDTCPWALDDLIDAKPQDIPHLITKLPTPYMFDIDVYMQLFPDVCVHLTDVHLDTNNIVSHNCEECTNHDRCLGKMDELYGPFEHL